MPDQDQIPDTAPSADASDTAPDHTTDAGAAAITVTKAPNHLVVYGRGFAARSRHRIEVDGVPYAGQVMGEDGTFTRQVPPGSRVAVIADDGAVVQADAS